MKIGGCKRCGNCCKADTLLFDLFNKEIPDSLKDFKCPYLFYNNKIAYCNQYKNRPFFCRDYPVEPNDLIKDCGFNFK